MVYCTVASRVYTQISLCAYLVAAYIPSPKGRGFTRRFDKSHKLKEDKSIICNSHVITEAQKKGIVKIIDNEVFDDNESNIALSKADFAKYVYTNHSSFAKLSVDGFRQIIDTIRKICMSEK